MATRLFLCLVLVSISCNGISGNRKYEHLKAFEKFSPYPWTQWLRFHPSAAAFAALGNSHPTPPPVLIPPVDPARFSTSQEQDDDDMADEDEDDEDIGFGFFKRAALDNSFTKQLNFSFWAGKPIPLPAGADVLSKLDDLRYSAAQKSLFLAKLFEALAKAVINSTALESNGKAQIAATSAKGDNEDEIVIPSEIERSVADSEQSENSDSSTTENSEESSTTSTPSMLEKKLDFLQRLSAIITTTLPPPVSTKKPKIPKAEKSKSKVKKTKGKEKPTSTTTTTTPASFSYEDVAKMILDVDE